MIVTLITRVLPILEQLSDEILVYQTFLEYDLQTASDESMDIMKSYTPLARFVQISKSVNLPSVIMDIFFSCAEKVCLYLFQ